MAFCGVARLSHEWQSSGPFAVRVIPQGWGRTMRIFQQFIKRGVPNRLPEEVSRPGGGNFGTLMKLALRQADRRGHTLRFMLSGEPQVPNPGALTGVDFRSMGTPWAGKDGEFVSEREPRFRKFLRRRTLVARFATPIAVLYVVGDTNWNRATSLARTVFFVKSAACRLAAGSFVVRTRFRKAKSPKAALLYVKRFPVAGRGKASEAGTIQPEKDLGVSRASTVVLQSTA